MHSEIDSSSQSFKLDLKTKLTYGLGQLSGALPNNILIFFSYFFSRMWLG